MDKGANYSTLRIYRPGDSCVHDADPAGAGKLSETEPSLAPGAVEEDELDRVIALKLQSAPAPADLKARLLNLPRAVIPSSARWTRKLTLVAAAIVVLTVYFSSWQGPFQPAVSLGDYRDEMVSFIRIDPVLEMETPQLSRITAFLKKAGAPSRLDLPQKLQQMQHPLGCRTLRFRGQDVTLICFGREQAELIHLFVVRRAALSHLRESDKALRYQTVGEWMTATWVEGDQAYLITVEGDRAKLEKYLSSS